MVLLLVIIYLAFISLGLPDAMLGSAWPSMYTGLGVSVGSAGILAMIISAGTVVSSLFSGRVIKRFGTGAVTAVSVLMTAVALLGFSFANSFTVLCILAIPMGLGAGCVDSALNNFVALHYKAKHMSWLHCFWGVGASIGPLIMSYSLVRLQSWHAGYRLVSILQFLLVLVLFMSLPLWKKVQPVVKETTPGHTFSFKKLIILPKAKQALILFICYCGIEQTVNLWGSSYLVMIRGISEVTAARWISLYFIGITLGRFISGFLAIKFSHKIMVRLGEIFIAMGLIVLLLPLHNYCMLIGLFTIGLGLAPIFPSLIHETPITFGKEYSQAMIGLQMASAYIGAAIIPPFFGVLGAKLSYGLFPAFIGILLAIMIVMALQLHEKTNNIAS